MPGFLLNLITFFTATFTTYNSTGNIIATALIMGKITFIYYDKDYATIEYTLNGKKNDQREYQWMGTIIIKGEEDH